MRDYTQSNSDHDREINQRLRAAEEEDSYTEVTMSDLRCYSVSPEWDAWMAAQAAGFLSDLVGDAFEKRHLVGCARCRKFDARFQAGKIDSDGNPIDESEY